eukprot:IDg21696t1
MAARNPVVEPKKREDQNTRADIRAIRRAGGDDIIDVPIVDPFVSTAARERTISSPDAPHTTTGPKPNCIQSQLACGSIQSSLFVHYERGAYSRGGPPSDHSCRICSPLTPHYLHATPHAPHPPRKHTDFCETRHLNVPVFIMSLPHHPPPGIYPAASPHFAPAQEGSAATAAPMHPLASLQGVVPGQGAMSLQVAAAAMQAAAAAAAAQGVLPMSGAMPLHDFVAMQNAMSMHGAVQMPGAMPMQDVSALQSMIPTQDPIHSHPQAATV